MPDHLVGTSFGDLDNLQVRIFINRKNDVGIGAVNKVIQLLDGFVDGIGIFTAV